MSTRLELYLDHVCPYSYMAFTAACRVSESLGLALELSFLPISAPAQGSSAADLAMHAALASADWPAIESLAGRDFGLRLQKPAPETRGIAAACLALQVRQASPALEVVLHPRLFAARFAEGKDLSDPGQLAVLAKEIGFSQAVTTRSLLDQLPALDAQSERAAAQGVTMVPTLVIGGSHLVLGAEPEPVLRATVEQLQQLTIGSIA
jgi:predicted DsbA family dithiol-disulfide isomerase